MGGGGQHDQQTCMIPGWWVSVSHPQPQPQQQKKKEIVMSIIFVIASKDFFSIQHLQFCFFEDPEAI